MATCLCDAFFDDVARSAVEILEFIGCAVEFPEGQTCCGQPAFNGGEWDASRKAVRHTLDVFQGSSPVVVPSGSCAAMISHGARLEFENENDGEKIEELASRSWELADFLVNGLGIESWPGTFSHRIAFHESCHCRGTGSGDAARQLLCSIEGLDLVPFDEKEQCCGFGGTFSIGFPHISTEMGRLKLDFVAEAQPDFLVSADMACLMHMGGLIDRDGRDLPRLHFAQVLRDALKSAG